MIEFLTVAAGAMSCMTYERELNFHRFLELPAELRLEVYASYLETARDNQTLTKHLHHDGYNKPCCMASRAYHMRPPFEQGTPNR
jgi:hypothetical protein